MILNGRAEISQPTFSLGVGREKLQEHSGGTYLHTPVGKTKINSLNQKRNK